MAFKADDDYNTVAERIVEFRAKYPEGSLQPLDITKPYEMVQMGNTLVFIVVAAAYRTPDDPRPGIGMAYEPIPGSTPFTRGSELQNAETAAWGRALIAVGAADAKKGIATREDVQNAQAREQYTAPPSQARVDNRPLVSDPDAVLRKEVTERISALGQADRAEFLNRWQTNQIPKLKELRADGLNKVSMMLTVMEDEIARRLNPAAAPDYAAPDTDSPYLNADA
jgi:hypothetical protein